MAVATTKTLLPLDRFFKVAGVHPLHANQISVQDIAPEATCDTPLFQYSWQAADRTGREEIAQVIASVEARLMDYLNFAPKPTYYANKPIVLPKFNNRYFSGVLTQAMDLGVGYIISGGQEQKSVLAANTTITYSDEDTDGYYETATVATTNVDALGNIVTAPRNVSVYYPDHNGEDEWEIRPVSVTIAGNTVTCVFKREQAALEALLFGYSVGGLDGLDNANFLEKVDVYHHWLDIAATQAQFSVSRTGETQLAIITPYDYRLGWSVVQAGHYDTTLGAYVFNCEPFMCDFPDKINAWFMAGWPLDAYGNMDAIWEQCITYLVLSELDRPLCACPGLAAFTAHWAYDLAANTQMQSRTISSHMLDNPLGTTRAAIFAWERILRYHLPDKA